MKMKKDKGISHLLLSYNQNMYFSSIEEILFFVTSKNKEIYSIPVYEIGSIDEYNRNIIKSETYKLELVKHEIESYGVSCFIDDLNSNQLKQKRLEYLKFKFPHKNYIELDKELEQTYLKGERIKLQYEPIVLEINDDLPNENEKILCILYKQSISWTKIKKSINKIAKKYYSRKPEFDENWINKYNRVFFKSSDEKLLKQIQKKFENDNIKTIILNEEEEFIPYRMEYIKYHYTNRDVYFLHSKWRLEFLNGWFNREKWPPIIFVKNK